VRFVSTFLNLITLWFIVKQYSTGVRTLFSHNDLRGDYIIDERDTIIYIIQGDLLCVPLPLPRFRFNNEVVQNVILFKYTQLL